MADRAVVLKTGVVAGGVVLDAAADHDVPRQTLKGVKGRIGAETRPIHAVDIPRLEARAQLNARMEVVALDGVPAQSVQTVGVDDVAIGGRAPGGEVEILGLVARYAEAPDKAAADVDLPGLGLLDRHEGLGLSQGRYGRYRQGDGQQRQAQGGGRNHERVPGQQLMI